MGVLDFSRMHRWRPCDVQFKDVDGVLRHCSRSGRSSHRVHWCFVDGVRKIDCDFFLDTYGDRVKLLEAFGLPLDYSSLTHSFEGVKLVSC